MALVGFQYEPVSLDVNKACSEEEQDTSNAREKLRKRQNVTEWCRCGKWDIVRTNVEYLSFGEIETLRYFQLLNMRYDDRNVVTEYSTTRNVVTE